MPKVSTPTEHDARAHHGISRPDDMTSVGCDLAGQVSISLTAEHTTVSITVSPDRRRVDILATSGNSGTRCAIPDSIVIRANRFLSTLPGAVILHRDWHTKTHGIRSASLRPVWLLAGVGVHLTLTGADTWTASTQNAPRTPTAAPTASTPAPSRAPRKRRVVVRGSTPPPAPAAQPAPTASTAPANVAPTIDAATGAPVGGSVEPFPTAPCAAMTHYQTWSGHKVSISGNATGGRAVLSINSRGLVGGALTADDATRLRTAIAGWGIDIVSHPRSGDQVVVEEASAYRSRRKYRPVYIGGSGAWQAEPAGALPFAGVPGGEPSLTAPQCGKPAPAALSAKSGQAVICRQPFGHDPADGHSDGRWQTWPDYAATAAAEIAEDEHAEAEDEPEVAPRFTLDTEGLPAGAHVYVPQAGLVERFEAAIRGIAAGQPGAQFLFVGPAGSGKGDGAAYLAAKYGLTFTKIDAASVTEPEAWFGTREIVEQDGVSVTRYEPSLFVRSVTQPGVTFVDEFTRARTAIHNIFLPLIDGTRKVTNPLNGEIVQRHPENIVILAANRGIEFVGTYDLDIALTSRVRTVEFGYPSAEIESAILRQATRCDDDAADVITRFTAETRALAARGATGIPPMSVREAMMAAQDAANGLPVDLAVESAYILDRSSEGGAASQRQVLRDLWAAVNAPALTRADAPIVTESGCAVPGCTERLATYGSMAEDGTRPDRRCALHATVTDPVGQWLTEQAAKGRKVVL